MLKIILSSSSWKDSCSFACFSWTSQINTRLPATSQATVKFVKDKLEEKENIPENENTASTSSSGSSFSSIKGYFTVETVTDAQILWVLDVISNHYCQDSCRNKNKLFAARFKDNKIAQSFSCGSTKCGYVVNFGLASFFKSLLAEALNDASHCICCFDESYNSVIKKRQMDMHVPYWDNTANAVFKRYWSSELLDKASANDIHSKFESCSRDLKGSIYPSISFLLYVFIILK